MSRSTNTKPEVRLQDGLRARGHAFETHAKDLPGTPDIVFRDSRLAIFVHGCYWHRHQGCKNQNAPTMSSVNSTKRLNTNVVRDAQVAGQLRQQHWGQYVAWECDVNERLADVLNQIEDKL
jgi:DNA mismatch endonuclease (patch repair protein)